jgi:hypothetical protein
MPAQAPRGETQGGYHAPGGEGAAHSQAYAGHGAANHGATAHGAATRGGEAARAGEHGGAIRSRALAGESGHGEGAAHEHDAHAGGGEHEHVAAHGEGAHGGGEREHAAARPSTPTVMRSHGRLVLAGAGAHAAPRPFLHGDARPDHVRDHALVDHDREFVHAHENDFHTRNVRNFGARELATWRGGLWRNEWHYGRRGWWWDVGGVWYPYEDPIWPFPLIVAPLTVYDVAIVDGPNLEAYEAPPPDASAAPAPDGSAPPAPDASAAPTPDGSATPAPDGSATPAPGAFQTPPGQAPAQEQASAADAIPPLPAPPPGWYRCPEPSGYFPSVGACSGSWTLVQEAPPSGAN